jgi:hypothetical protein
MRAPPTLDGDLPDPQPRLLSVVDFADDRVAGNDDVDLRRGRRGDRLVGAVTAIQRVVVGHARHSDGRLRAGRDPAGCAC